MPRGSGSAWHLPPAIPEVPGTSGRGSVTCLALWGGDAWSAWHFRQAVVAVAATSGSRSGARPGPDGRLCLAVPAGHPRSACHLVVRSLACQFRSVVSVVPATARWVLPYCRAVRGASRYGTRKFRLSVPGVSGTSSGRSRGCLAPPRAHSRSAWHIGQLFPQCLVPPGAHTSGARRLRSGTAAVPPAADGRRPVASAHIGGSAWHLTSRIAVVPGTCNARVGSRSSQLQPGNQEVPVTLRPPSPKCLVPRAADPWGAWHLRSATPRVAGTSDVYPNAA
jgi:hypothetical protein